MLLRAGCLVSRAGRVSPRLLRYYENQGLLAAERSSGGQRLFDVAAIERVRYTRSLLRAGLPTHAVAELLG